MGARSILPRRPKSQSEVLPSLSARPIQIANLPRRRSRRQTRPSSPCSLRKVVSRVPNAVPYRRNSYQGNKPLITQGGTYTLEWSAFFRFHLVRRANQKRANRSTEALGRTARPRENWTWAADIPGHSRRLTAHSKQRAAKH